MHKEHLPKVDVPCAFFPIAEYVIFLYNELTPRMCSRQPEPWRVDMLRSGTQDLRPCRTFEAELLDYTRKLHDSEKEVTDY